MQLPRAVAQSLRPHAIHLDETGQATGRFHACHLVSAFQSVVCTKTGGEIGWEGYIRLRAPGGDALSPWGLFALAADGEDLVRLDRLCRVLHALNGAALLPASTRLFLNVHRMHVERIDADLGIVFARFLELLSLSPARCAIDIETREPLGWPASLRYAQAFRARGFGVAIDLGHHAGLWLHPLFDHDDWRPDVVKFEPALWMLGSDVPARIARWRTAGIEVIATRVGSHRAVRWAERLGVSAMQGRAVSRTLLAGGEEGA